MILQSFTMLRRVVLVVVLLIVVQISLKVTAVHKVIIQVYIRI